MQAGIIGVTLIAFSSKFADKLVSKDPSEDAPSNITGRDIQSIAFSVVGVLVVALAIPTVFPQKTIQIRS